MPTIRKARQDEVKQLQDLNDEAFTANPDFDPDLVLDWAQSETGKTYFSSLLSNPEDLCLVAEDSGTIVGYIAVSPHKFGHRMSKYIEIENLGVIPSHRTKGLGKQLIEEAMAWAKTHGYEKVVLNSYFKNETALKFYKNLGFEPISIDLEKDI